jgi:hypothetical protein
MKYNVLALVMSYCDKSGEQFIVKVADMLNNKPHRFYPAIHEYSDAVLNNAPHKGGL